MRSLISVPSEVPPPCNLKPKNHPFVDFQRSEASCHLEGRYIAVLAYRAWCCVDIELIFSAAKPVQGQLVVDERHYESYGLVRILQVSSAVEYPGDVQNNDIGYRHATLKPASAVIQRKVLLSRGNSKKP